jgi:hypothetical protein
MVFRILLAVLAVAGAQAQSIRILSALQRVDPFGAVVAADQAERPREILSPALARNAFATFQVVVTVPAGQPHSLFVAQNPENAVGVAAYKPAFVKRGDAWIPDGLEPLTLSSTGEVPDVARQVPGQTVEVIWLDLWVSPSAPVRRTRLEVQLSVGGHWIIYPMELRIISPIIPGPAGHMEPLAPIEASIADTAAGPLRAWMCSPANATEEGPLTVRRLVRRNARQDLALARELESKLGKPELLSGILAALGATDRAQWCATPAATPAPGAEWYLSVRDYLYRTAKSTASAP